MSARNSIDRDELISMNPKLWCRLPLEMKRNILVHLALISRHLARKLRLISRDVNILVLPLLYYDLMLVNPNQVHHFVTTLLPKRKNHIPALKSQLHVVPRPLSTYDIRSLALGINCRRPSIENSLASVAPAFTKLVRLAIASHNLSSHAYWLRQHPIRPRYMMIFHYGSPSLVNFHDPLFSEVTHLFTSLTHGHRYSSVADLPLLTHLAIHTRSDLPHLTIFRVVSVLADILDTCSRLDMLVLSIQCLQLDDPLFDAWSLALAQLLQDRRFFLVPDNRCARMEWHHVVSGGPTIWDYASAWRDRGQVDRLSLFSEQKEKAGSFLIVTGMSKQEWDLDLIERDNYSRTEADEGSIEYRGELQYNSGV